MGALLLYTYAISPLLSGEGGGASELEAERVLLAKYKKSIAMEEVYRKALDEKKKMGIDLTGRLLSGSTTALAAAELSNLIRSYAEQSSVYINRENVNPAKEAGGHQEVSLQLTITCDVIGLRDFLALISSSEKLLDVETLQVTSRVTRSKKPSRYTGRGRMTPLMGEESTETELNITVVVSGYMTPRSSGPTARGVAGGALGEKGKRPERQRPVPLGGEGPLPAPKEVLEFGEEKELE